MIPLRRMQDCIFCKILGGEIPSTQVYQDEYVVAIMDIRPVHLGHVLLIPRDHVEQTLDMDAPTLMHMTAAMQHVARGVVSATRADGWNLGANSGAAAGQAVFHAHWHIIPRYTGDGLKHWADEAVTHDQLTEMGGKIRAELTKEL